MTTKDHKKIIIFDIDGTLANIEHRRRFVASKPKNWPAFNRAIPQDTPHEDIVWLAHVMWERGCIVLLASGRGEESREVTEAQMKQFGVQYNHMYMRKAKDSRSDDIVKKEILDQIREEHGEPYMVFDDRDQVVSMWRREGVRCCQVAPGDF